TTEVTEQVDITGNTTLPQLPGLAKYAVLSLDFLKPYPAIEQSIVQPVVDSLINPLHFSYSEPVNNIGNELPLRITLEDNPVEGEFTLDGQKITFVPLQPLALARCYEVSSHNSPLRGVAANDEVLAQSISVCAPEARLDIPQRNYALEGSSYPLAVATAESINISTITSGFVRIAPEGVAASPVAFNWNNPIVAVPVYPEGEYPDGQIVRVTVSGMYANKALTLANEISLRVLQVGGDFDGDGLTNELEIAVGLDPTNPDSDGNGIPDGEDDLDGDGLSNLEEVTAGTSLTDSDSDGDGLSDYDEIYIHYTNPNNPDPDGDGVPDYVEVISESDPTSD